MKLLTRPQRQRLRHAAKRGLNKVLSQLYRPAPVRELAPLQVRRVLLIRINHRLGNILFLTPLLNALEVVFPAATVDVVIGDQALAPLLGNRPQVGKVFGFVPMSWGGLVHGWRILRQLRRVPYDLVIDPAPDSSSDRLVSALVTASARVGFQTPGQWLPLTHPVALPKPPCHEARVPLALVLPFVTAPPPPFNPCLDLRLSPEELRAAAGTQPRGQQTIGFFVEARDGKRLPSSWWTDWVAAIRHQAPQVQLVQILAPGATPLCAGVRSMGSADLRHLGALLTTLDLFVSGDTGPMHLASGAGVTTLGLFNTTHPALYGPLGPADEALRVTGRDPQGVAAQALQRLRGGPPASPGGLDF